MIKRVIRGPLVESTTVYGEPQEIDEADSIDNADLITSEADQYNEDGEMMHAPVLDLDFTAALVPSTTPGKYHLYLDKLIPESNYFRLLEVLAEVGVLEEGYVSASLDRGYTAVRLPWVEKPPVSPEEEAEGREYLETGAGSPPTDEEAAALHDLAERLLK